MSITCSPRLASATQMSGEDKTSNKVVLLAQPLLEEKKPQSKLLEAGWAAKGQTPAQQLRPGLSSNCRAEMRLWELKL